MGDSRKNARNRSQSESNYIYLHFFTFGNTRNKTTNRKLKTMVLFVPADPQEVSESHEHQKKMTIDSLFSIQIVELFVTRVFYKLFILKRSSTHSHDIFDTAIIFIRACTHFCTIDVISLKFFDHFSAG